MMVDCRYKTVLGMVVAMLLEINEVKSIVGGQTAMPGTAPYVVAVREVAGSAFICAGVLVTPTWVLSTAQCVIDKTEADLSVLHGSHRLLTNKRGLFVSQIVRHTAYDTTTGAHNLALLKLSEAALLSTRTSIIALNDAIVVSGRLTTFYGWGAVAYGSTSYSNNLQSLIQHTLSTTDCRTLITNLADGNICASIQPGQAPCTKDEGGPLVNYQTGKLVGIFSYGTQCSGTLPNVFIDVYTHKSWIDATAV